jgi:transposase
LAQLRGITLAGKLLVIWDGSPIHRGTPVKEVLAAEEEERLQLERLPRYAPELNPDEGIWPYLKRVELKNVCCKHVKELQAEVRRAKQRVRQRRDVIRGCLRQPGYII